MSRLNKLFLIILLAAGPGAAYGQDISVTLLGTGDPTPRLDRFGPSTLVAAAKTTILVDAGRGVMQRLYQLGVSSGEIDAIFLTHLHSDHVVGLVDLWLTGWVVNGRERPLRVFGPIGTKSMVEHLSKAFAFDINIRISEAGRDPMGIAIEVVELEDEFRWETEDVEVVAFLVDHSPVEPAFGFRINSLDRSVVISGDTRYSESLIRHAAGTDLLIHEVAEAPASVRLAQPNLPRLAHHTSAEDAGRVFTAVQPELAVFSHLVLVRGFNSADLIPLTRVTYDGRLIVGEDLMILTIGDTVTVKRAKLKTGLGE